jgi:hypothetical protein
MPTTDTTPADGTQTVAAAQVLNRRVLVVRAQTDLGVPIFPNFGPGGSAPFAPRRLREETSTQVNNLPSVFIHLFLLPTFVKGTGGATFRAQNNIEWRPVFQMPPDVFPSDSGTASDEWIPMASPMILPVAVPVAFKCCCAGIEKIAIEIRIGAGVLDDDQGENQIVFSISASS